jgi:glycosyltransferase involved in cell wall biosynthesis
MTNTQRQYNIDFYIVIPCFEESKRLPSYLEALVKELERQPFHSQILVVDDGSSQQERSRLLKSVYNYKEKHPLILDPLVLERNRGKGYAVRAGCKAGINSKWLVMLDADGATPAYEVIRVLHLVHKDNNERICYLCSRIRMLGRTVHRDWKRHIMGRLYATLVGWIINQSVYDSQCGFKIITGKAFHAIYRVLEEDRFAFDSELIAALFDAGFSLEEIPIDWHDIAGSKISLLRDSYRMIISLFEIQRRRKKWMLSNKGN